MGVFISIPEVRGVVKWVHHIAVSQCELERICSDAQHSPGMTGDVARSIGLSRALPGDIVLIVIAHRVDWEPDLVCDRIVASKKIGTDQVLVRANLRLCLRALLAAHQAMERMMTLKGQVFDEQDPTHVVLLGRLWSNMFPGRKRTSSAIISPDWTELGFQCNNPVSDFRGGGMLGLHQLVAFAELFPGEARQLLTESVNPKRYFPFAATGINFTAFVCELMSERRLTVILFQSQQLSGMDMEMSTEERGIKAVAEVYGQQYLCFRDEWVRRNPSMGVMAFPGIFKDMKEQARTRFPPLIPLGKRFAGNQTIPL